MTRGVSFLEVIGATAIALLVTGGLAYSLTMHKSTEIHLSAPIKGCIEPENPYGIGSAYYVGFESGKKSSDCRNEVRAFTEGCELYRSLSLEYSQCHNSQVAQ